MNTTTKHPNYRIYDLTGGGTTEDIYADSLEAAIEAGREWIEAGDWNSSDDGVYRTIALECEIRKIVYSDDGEIDGEATGDGEAHDCSGTFSDEIPECKIGGEHDWRSPYSCVGGIKENPGVWSNGGTAMTFKSVCACCGMYKTERNTGSQRNPDEPLETIEIDESDADSRAWLMRRLCLPDEIEIEGVTVTLEWDKSADITDEDSVIGRAIHTVPSAELDEGTAGGPSDGETFDHEGITFRLGSHDYETNGDETTCTASIYRVL